LQVARSKREELGERGRGQVSGYKQQAASYKFQVPTHPSIPSLKLPAACNLQPETFSLNPSTCPLIYQIIFYIFIRNLSSDEETNV